MKDTGTRFHEEWLGLAQPIEGLVFSIPALVAAQIEPKVKPELSARLEAHLDRDAERVALRDVRAFFEGFLGYGARGHLVAREALPKELAFYAEEGRQEIRPSFAIARGPFGAADDDPFAAFEDAPKTAAPAPADPSRSPYLALVWDLTDDAGAAAIDLDLDKSETGTGPWSYPPTAKLDRLLRHVGVPIGFLTNRRELRLVYAPAGESSAHLTFRMKDLAERAGRPLVAALDLLFHASRTYTAAPEFTFEGLLHESRRRQADVTKELAEQVFEAVELLLEGFERAAARDAVGERIDYLRAALDEEGDHLYQGVLSVVLRLVFLLYAEDQGLLPVDHPVYAEHLSVLGLYERLAHDAGAHPESMHHRFGAYGRLLGLFRAVYLGVRHGDLVLPARRGRLFDPSQFPFLEGGLPGWTSAILLAEERARREPPSVDDGTIYKVLHRLVVFEGQRLSYRALDVEQIGSVYESLMGYHVLRAESPAVRLGKLGVWVEVAKLRAMSGPERKRFLKETCALSPAAIAKAEKALAAKSEAEVHGALAELVPERARERHRAEAGRLLLQPGDERRRTGSHYTPRSLTEKVVRRTLEPLLACLGEERTAEEILELKVCDPAMGSGAFLVEACRHLAEEVVAAWTRSGELARMAEEHPDPLLHARRLVAQRCLYGVDKNAAAVELAKLSLWLVTLSRDLPFTFVDHALRHGDSLVGLDLRQIKAFDWAPKKQLTTCEAVLDDALRQAIEHRARILELATREGREAQEEKQRLLGYAEQATARVRMLADACIGCFFDEAKPKERERERARRLGLVLRYLDGDEGAGEDLAGLAAAIRKQHAPFHWMIEFPEVFYQERPDPLQGGDVNGAAFMEAFVGNPPFLGGRRISTELGDPYSDWLDQTHGAGKNGDLSAHFFRRAATLLGAHGAMGLIATNTISQGDTRTTALAPLIAQRWKIFDATNSMAWPGAAAVTVSLVHVAHGLPADRSNVALDGAPVLHINSRLRAGAEQPNAVALRANASCSFQGSILVGTGFTLTPDERDALVRKNGRNAERIFPYLGGEEVNTSPTQSHDRFAISFGSMSLEEAERWPDLIAIVRRKVKPDRDGVKRDAHRKFWWHYGDKRPALYEAIAPLSRCLVTSQVSKHLVFAFQSTDRIFSHALYVFPLESHTAFATLQSRVHEPWARLLSSSLEDRLRYAASDCFETFPFPDADPRKVIPAVEAAGEALYTARAAFMVETNQGLTKTYNALKDPSVDDPRIVSLRTLHEAMDRAVLDAYGWQDLEVPPFCPASPAERKALEAFEDEVIDRLYLLNEQRAAEEARLGLGATKGKKGGAKAKGKSRKTEPEGQGGLFG